MPLQYVLAILLLTLPCLILYRRIKETLQAETSRSRTPFKKKMLRPAGESLRLKLLDLRDDITEKGLLLSCFISVPTFTLFVRNPGSPLIPLLAWGILALPCYPLAIVQWRKLQGLREKFRRYALGFDGERYVAAELDLLRSEGYLVYHDFLVDWIPGGDETTFNIDHIVVGEQGVFAIETKAWRQPKSGTEDHKPHELKIEGECVILPSKFPAEKAIPQAKWNAAVLSQWLQDSGFPGIPVIPVLVFPGWYIDEEQEAPILVRNAERVGKALRDVKAKPLPPRSAKAIAARIEQHCRNIDHD